MASGGRYEIEYSAVPMAMPHNGTRRYVVGWVGTGANPGHSVIT